jgi:glycoprotein-N-acetylgalactosamine 3-beta-galactosyltransferase
VATALNRAVRVLCWVMTTPDNHLSKAVHIQATWGRRCTKLLFVSEQEDTGALSAIRVDVEAGREHLTAKTMSAFQHIYDHHIDDAEWFLKVSVQLRL